MTKEDLNREFAHQWAIFAGDLGRARAGFRLGTWPDRAAESAAARGLESELLAPLSGKVLKSVSHSKHEDSGCIAVVGLVTSVADQNPTPEVLQIGVDLEHQARVIAPPVVEKLRARLIGDSEERFGLSTLDFWVIKEAAFKATPDNRGTFISQYGIQDFNAATGAGSIVHPPPIGRDLIIHFKLVQVGDWKAGFAFSLRRGQ